MPKKPKPAPPKFKVGDWATYPRSPGRVLVRVTELRGPLAPGGEQVYRIREVYDWGEVHEFETVESALETSPPPEREPVAKPPEEWGRWTG